MNGKIKILNRYNVYVGLKILAKLPKLLNLSTYSKIVVITDLVVSNHWLKLLEKNLPGSLVRVIIPVGEQSKNIETIQKIWLNLLKNSCDRKSLIINFGGGATLDAGGFAASTFMRGIPFLQIPTTLLAQVDASVGGKVGINFAGIKNLVGTFNQPVGVICDTQLLSTLPDREFIAGFAEIIKHGAIADKKYFEFTTSKKPQEFSKQELIKVILGSIKIKTSIINKDEKEMGKRKLINFGHTIGHAIESLSLETPTPLLHGEAISIGIIVEARISNLIRKLPSSDLQLIRQSLINATLPISIPKIDPEKIIKKMLSDKKNVKGKINFTLLKGIGKAIVNQTIPDNIIRKALI